MYYHINTPLHMRRGSVIGFWRKLALLMFGACIGLGMGLCVVYNQIQDSVAPLPVQVGQP